MINFNLISTMSGKDQGSAAKKIQKKQEGWEIPETVQKEKGSDEFIYTKPERISKKTSEEVKKVIKIPVEVGAEDSLNNGMETVLKLLKEKKYEMPKQLMVLGGPDSIRDVSMAVENHKLVEVKDNESTRNNVYVSADAGDHPYNQDGMVAYYDEAFDRLHLFQAHGPQFDPLAINIANTAAVKAASDIVMYPEIKSQELLNRVKENVLKVEQEFGDADKQLDLSYIQLYQSGNFDQYTLDVQNPGRNHILVIDLDTGKFRSLSSSDKLQKVEVKTGEIIVSLNDELLQAFPKFKKESLEMFISNRFFMERQSGKPLKTICDELINDARKNGLDSGVSVIAVQVPKGINIKFD